MLMWQAGHYTTRYPGKFEGETGDLVRKGQEAKSDALGFLMTTLVSVGIDGQYRF